MNMERRIFTAGLAALIADSAAATGKHDLATTRVFHAKLAASNMTTFTESPGYGDARFVLDLPTLKLTYAVEFKDLTSAPTSIFVHGPAHPGTNAPRMLDLAPRGARVSPVEGELVVTEAQVQYMLLSWAYVMIGTAKNPDGELRGKFEVIPPD
jgi:hypothetical protein